MKEIWKDISGYEGFYLVSNMGRVKSLPYEIKYINKYGVETTTNIKGKILNPSKVGRGWDDGDGYLSVTLHNRSKNRRFLVHRLVAKAFVPNPDGKPQVNHIDGDKANNRADNLEWCTREENMRHAYYTLKRLSTAFKSVKVICVETNEVFDSIAIAARANRLDRRTLSSAIQQNKLYGGFHWRRV